MWKGFFKESKSYMDYPICGKLRFWLRLPIAFIKFHYFEIKNR